MEYIICRLLRLSKIENSIMTISAINSVSLYEYYYTINDTKKRKSSPLEKEMRKYGLVPTDSEQTNIAMLNKARELEKARNEKEKPSQASYSDRPWADIMYQLNISFNEDPADDIVDIKEKLNFLLKGIEDEELDTEINDLENYVERLYLDYDRVSSGFSKSATLTSQLNNLSLINKATML